MKDSEAATDIPFYKSGVSSGNICKWQLCYLRTVETLSAFQFKHSGRFQSSHSSVNPKFRGGCSLSAVEKSVKNCMRNEKDMNNRVIE